jgi:hypothetical protein
MAPVRNFRRQILSELSASLIVLLFYQVLLGLFFGWQWITVRDLKRLEDSFVAIQTCVDDN